MTGEMQVKKIIRAPETASSIGKLGWPLTHLEERCYRAICFGGIDNPVSVSELSETLYGCTDVIEATASTLRRVKDKLGETSIICIKNVGYLSRRSIIEQEVARICKLDNRATKQSE